MFNHTEKVADDALYLFYFDKKSFEKSAQNQSLKTIYSTKLSIGKMDAHQTDCYVIRDSTVNVCIPLTNNY